MDEGIVGGTSELDGEVESRRRVSQLALDVALVVEEDSRRLNFTGHVSPLRGIAEV